MARKVGGLFVSLSANTALFSKGMTRARKKLSGFTVAVTKNAKRVAMWGSALTAAGTAAMTLAVRSQLKYIDTLAKTSDKLGIATEGLAKLRYAGELTGVEVRTMDMALQRMTRRLAEAAIGTGEAKGAIKTLGLDAGELVKLGPEKAFYRIADALRQVKSPAEKVRLSFKLFDSEGVALKNTLDQGSDALRLMGKDAERLGLAISRFDAAKVEQANDAMTNLKSALKGAAQQITVALAPWIKIASDKLTDMGVEGDWATKTIVQGIENASQLFGKMANAIHVANIGLMKGRALLAEYSAMALDFWNWLSDAKHQHGFMDLISPKEAEFSVNLQEAMIEEAHKLADAINELEKQPWPSENMEKYFDTLKKGVEDAARITAQNAESMSKPFLDSAEAINKQSDALQKMVDRLKEEVATFGMSRREIELWKISRMDASDAEKRLARELVFELMAKEAAEKAAKEAAKGAGGKQGGMADLAPIVFGTAQSQMAAFRHKNPMEKLEKLEEKMYAEAQKQTGELTEIRLGLGTQPGVMEIAG